MEERINQLLELGRTAASKMNHEVADRFWAEALVMIQNNWHEISLESLLLMFDKISGSRSRYPVHVEILKLAVNKENYDLELGLKLTLRIFHELRASKEADGTEGEWAISTLQKTLDQAKKNLRELL